MDATTSTVLRSTSDLSGAQDTPTHQQPRRRGAVVAIDAGGFVMLPNAVSDDRGLSVHARFLYSRLQRYAGGRGHCWPSQARLAADLDVCERKVRYLLAELEARGRVEIIRRGRTCSNVYRLLPLAGTRRGTAAARSDRHGCADHTGTGVPTEVDSVKKNKSVCVESGAAPEVNANANAVLSEPISPEPDHVAPAPAGIQPPAPHEIGTAERLAAVEAAALREDAAAAVHSEASSGLRPAPGESLDTDAAWSAARVDAIAGEIGAALAAAGDPGARRQSGGFHRRIGRAVVAGALPHAAVAVALGRTKEQAAAAGFTKTAGAFFGGLMRPYLAAVDGRATPAVVVAQPRRWLSAGEQSIENLRAVARELAERRQA